MSVNEGSFQNSFVNINLTTIILTSPEVDSLLVLDRTMKVKRGHGFSGDSSQNSRSREAME